MKEFADRFFSALKKFGFKKLCEFIAEALYQFSWHEVVTDEDRKVIKKHNDCHWEGREICLLTPMYKFPHPNMVYCLLAMWDRGIMRLEHRQGDSMIARSRNHLAKRFLDTPCKWSVWFDDDMVFPFGNAHVYATILGFPKHIPHEFMAVHTINRLTSWDKTIVGGLYWDRRGSGRLIAGGKSPIMHAIPSNNLAIVKFNGTGCLAVHRQVYEDIIKKFPEVLTNMMGNESGFFTPIMGEDGRMWGEDESFAWRAAQAGHDSFIDLGTICGHYGEQVATLPTTGSKI